MQEIVVAGGGFAGLWASLAAVRELECAGATARVSLVSVSPGSPGSAAPPLRRGEG